MDEVKYIPLKFCKTQCSKYGQRYCYVDKKKCTWEIVVKKTAKYFKKEVINVIENAIDMSHSNHPDCWYQEDVKRLIKKWKI